MESEPRIQIFPAAPKDVRGMQEVLYRTWLATFPDEKTGITVDDIDDRYKNAFTEESLKRGADIMANPREGETHLVAKEGDRVVGVCRVIEREDANQLQAIYVLPEYQRRGVGRLLYEEAQKVFDPKKDIIVQVATYNTNAIEFYKRLGFQDTGKRWEDEKFKMKSGAVLPQLEMAIMANRK